MLFKIGVGVLESLFSKVEEDTSTQVFSCYVAKFLRATFLTESMAAFVSLVKYTLFYKQRFFFNSASVLLNFLIN